MPCSFPSRNTGSSWLSRLRTAKGFPDNGASDLEDFLRKPHSSSSDSPTPCPDKPPTFESTKYEDLTLFNAICELFNFGDSCCSSTKVKRPSRKQVNPRLCAFSDNGDADINNFDAEKICGRAASRSSDSYGGVEDSKESNQRKDEGDGQDVDLPGFSRTEVTVIDTSYEQWKFEKLLLRKKNVWKVRDIKRKSEILGSKKRRKLSGCVDDRHAKKKHEVRDADAYDVGCEPPLNRVSCEDYC